MSKLTGKWDMLVEKSLLGGTRVVLMVEVSVVYYDDDYEFIDFQVIPELEWRPATAVDLLALRGAGFELSGGGG